MADLLMAIIGISQAVGTLGAVGVALWLGLRQRSADREALYNSQRPILVPAKATFKRRLSSTESPTDQDALLVDSVGFKFNEPYYLFELRNVGPGAALNVDGIIAEPQPDQPSTTLARGYRLDVGIPMAPGETVEVCASEGETKLHGTTQIVPGYNLYAPQAPSEGDILHGVGEVKVRFTLTCSDTFGKIHGFVYDYVQDHIWIYRTSQKVDKSIEELNRDANRQLILGPSAVAVPASLEDYAPNSEQP
jgi:hypothetical protein